MILRSRTWSEQPLVEGGLRYHTCTLELFARAWRECTFQTQKRDRFQLAELSTKCLDQLIKSCSRHRAPVKRTSWRVASDRIGTTKTCQVLMSGMFTELLGI